MTDDPRRQWCAVLAKLVSPMDAHRAAAAFVDMLPMLSADERYYTPDTAKRVAKAERKTSIPTFGDIEAVFAEIYRERLPYSVRTGGSASIGVAVERISGTVTPSRTPEEIQAVRAQVAALKAEFAAARPAREVTRPAPSYLDKLTLARIATPAVLASRPDLIAMLEMAGRNRDER